MSKTLLLYERAVPITKTQHASHSVKPGSDFGFAREINSMPLLAQEFRIAAREFPILFAGNSDQVVPAVLLGFGPDENLFVDAEGRWRAKYIPAFVRRYPYIFSSVDQGKTLTLCIDEEFPGLNTEGEGERLFTEDGEQTDYLNRVLQFQKDFQIAHQRTLVFCKRLLEFDLLEPIQAQLKFSSGEQKFISGFMGVNRGKMKALDGEKLRQLNRVDELELIYLHLQSLLNIDAVAKQLPAADAAPESPESKTKAPAEKSASKATPKAKKATDKKAPAKKAAAKSRAKKSVGKNGSSG